MNYVSVNKSSHNLLFRLYPLFILVGVSLVIVISAFIGLFEANESKVSFRVGRLILSERFLID